MAKKAASKATKKVTSKSKTLSPLEKLAHTLDEIGQRGHQLTATDFGRGQHGYSTFLCGEDGHALVRLELISKDDGTWRVKTELTTWLQAEIEKAGFKISERKRPKGKERAIHPDNDEEGIIKLHR